MYTVYHIIWLIISVASVAAGLILLKKYNVPLNRLLSIACVGSILSEVVKTLSVIKMVPLADGSGFTPYIEMSQVPLHLCSFQIILIFYTRFTKNEKIKQLLLSFMYPTCSVGAFLAIMIPTVFTDSIKPEHAFISPHAYQYFLYHAMLVVLGLYIYISGEANLKPKNYFTTVGILLSCAFLSFYLNSIFAAPVYDKGEIALIEHMPNFFFTFQTPIGIALNKLSHWYIYLAIICALGFLLIGLFYIPVFIKAKKEKKQALAEEEKEKVLINS